MAPIGTVPLFSRILPQNPTVSEGELLLAVTPPQIIQTGTAVSTDKNTITILGSAEQDDSATSTKSTFVRYDVPSQTLISAARFIHAAPWARARLPPMPPAPMSFWDGSC